VLTLQNHVNNLTAMRSVKAGTLTVRAWDTLRAAVQLAALTRPGAPTPDQTPWVRRDLPLMARGLERC
jgi:hypothetical protein